MYRETGDLCVFDFEHRAQTLTIGLRYPPVRKRNTETKGSLVLRWANGRLVPSFM
jgi:hypothetical protein